jgi:hypothetical protein
MLTRRSALFLLFIQYSAPTGTFDDDTLAAVRSAGEEVSFNWPKIGWIFVFQYPIVEILCVAIQEATQVTGELPTITRHIETISDYQVQETIALILLAQNMHTFGSKL